MKVYLKNDGTINKNRVIIETDTKFITLYFSYETIIGFVFDGERVVSQNDWSVTTGKYLNELEPDKSKRIPHGEVLEKLENIFKDF